MKLKEFLQQFEAIKKEVLYWEELEVIYALDDEGNGYHPIVFDAEVGKYYPSIDEFEATNQLPTAVCIN